LVVACILKTLKKTTILKLYVFAYSITAPGEAYYVGLDRMSQPYFFKFIFRHFQIYFGHSILLEIVLNY
jgi:hypothetical protein